jgi:hypothetical protein
MESKKRKIFRQPGGEMNGSAEIADVSLLRQGVSGLTHLQRHCAGKIYKILI